MTSQEFANVERVMADLRKLVIDLVGQIQIERRKRKELEKRLARYEASRR